MLKFMMQNKTIPQRRQQVTSQKRADDDSEDDDLSYDFNTVTSTPSIGLAGGRAMRSHSPMVIKLLLVIIILNSG